MANDGTLPNQGFAKEFVGPYGQFLTPHVRDMIYDDNLEKRLAADAQKPAFVVPAGAINDWTGQHFVKNNYGHPYERKDIQLSESTSAPVDWMKGQPLYLSNGRNDKEKYAILEQQLKAES